MSKDQTESHMKHRRRSFKGFYYFRMGYSTYFAMIVGTINILTTTYFLAAKKIPFIVHVFPTFLSYVLFLAVIGTPLIILFGWLHYKRIGTYAAEANIVTESSPYSYKLPPGYAKEVFGPAYVAILKLAVKKTQGETLSEEEIESIKKIEDQLVHLTDGGHVGNPPKGLF